MCGIPIIDTEQSFNDPTKQKFYRDNFNFFCAVNWLPMADAISTRNRLKRSRLIDVIEHHQLNCISIVDRFAKVSKTTKIGRGCFIDGCTHIMPRVSIGNYTNIHTHTNIGHDAVLGNNCVIQRMCVVPPSSILENNVFFGSAVKALKEGVTFGEGTFVHEGIYIKRGTIKNEIVSMHGDNMRRIVSQYIE
jgi:UDP-3-O-[3-hydroxymyristoyl] glucosamine N-acyltransferase